MKKVISIVLCLVLVLSLVISAYAIAVVKVTGIKLSKSSVTLDVGSTEKLNVTFTPENTTQKLLKFTTSDKNIATITTDGIVKAVKPGKATITVNSASNSKLSAKLTVTVKAKEPTTLTLMVFDRGNVGGTPPDNNFYSKWIQSTFNKANPDIKVKFVTAPRWTSDDKLNIWMASNQAPDISLTYNIDLVYNYYKQGGLTQLDTALSAYGQELKAFLGNDVLKRGKYYGQQWSIPAKRVINAQNNTWIRKDWLDKLDLPIPTTRQEFYYVMKAFKEKNPGNTEKVVPFGMGNDVKWVANNLLESFVTKKDDESRYYCSANLKLLAEGYKDGVQFLNKMYNEGLVSPEFALDTEAKILESDFSNGQVGSYIQNYDMPLRSAGTGYIPTMKDKIKGFEFIPIDPFKDKDGVTTKIIYDQAGLRIIVPKTSQKKVNEAMRYLNWMTSKEVIFFLQYGEEGIGHVMKDGLPIYQPVKTGDKQFNSSNNIDYTYIVNGIDTGDLQKNIKINSLAYGDVQDLYIKSYNIAITNGYIEPAVSFPSESDAKYSKTLIDKAKEVYAKTITCKPADFEATWKSMMNEFMKAGAEQVLAERKELWKKEMALKK